MSKIEAFGRFADVKDIRDASVVATALFAFYVLGDGPSQLILCKFVRIAIRLLQNAPAARSRYMQVNVSDLHLLQLNADSAVRLLEHTSAQ